MDYQTDKITFTVELTRPEAWALAQFVKRTTHQDCADNAMGEDEAYEMMRGLMEIGINPR